MTPKEFAWTLQFVAQHEYAKLDAQAQAEATAWVRSQADACLTNLRKQRP